mmetsp:Transcript_4495/g.7349  ORF Transcript_4495/g.7349 Transcript_4495/m.7349 type:complete len:110 (-) Transcript_4495:51-380(-)
MESNNEECDPVMLEAWMKDYFTSPAKQMNECKCEISPGASCSEVLTCDPDKIKSFIDDYFASPAKKNQECDEDGDGTNISKLLDQLYLTTGDRGGYDDGIIRQRPCNRG